MTAVPLGQLRRECGEWRSDRWYRLGVAPFLLPVRGRRWGEGEIGRQGEKECRIPRCLPFSPSTKKRFCDPTDADWHDPYGKSEISNPKSEIRNEEDPRHPRHPRNAQHRPHGTGLSFDGESFLTIRKTRI